MTKLRVLMITSQLPTDGRALDMAPLARQIESLRRAGAEVDVLQVTGRRGLKYLTTLPELRRRARGADVLHGHYAYCGWLARAQWHKPVVCSFMGDDVLGTPDAEGRVSRLSRGIVATSRALARRVDAAIVKSAEMAEVLAPAATHIIPNGVDFDQFQPREPALARAELGWTDAQRYVLFPGNPQNPRKGFDLAQRAVAEAQTRLEEPLQLVRLWGVPPAEVPGYMNACDAMLMTSWLEGSPNVVKEALACNLPVVGVPVGDVAEMLADVENCAVHPRDPALLGDALACVLRRGARSNGRAALEDKGLDLDRVAQRILQVYDEVLRRRPLSRPQVDDLVQVSSHSRV